MSASPLHYQDFYNRHAEDMDTKWKDFVQVQCDWLLNRLKIIFPENATFSVIDLGCGTGEMLRQIGDAFPKALLYGIDGSPEMVEKALLKTGNRAKILEADLKDFKTDCRYDVILSTTVLHHLLSPSEHLADMHNLLSEDGHIFVSELAINTPRLFLAHLWWSWTQKSHHQAWNENDFRYLLECCGFDIVNGAILSPDRFWRIQMYHLQLPQP